MTDLINDNTFTLPSKSSVRYYAGIGARKTPDYILNLMTMIASKLEQKGFMLRSGGALGADTAFSNGTSIKEIYVPWNGFNGLELKYPIYDEAFKIAEMYHPNYNALSQGAKILMARNTMQLLGHTLTCPLEIEMFSNTSRLISTQFKNKSEFVICWTPDGCINSYERSSSTGGTGQAIHIAYELGIPVFNLARQDHKEKLETFVNNK